MNQSEEAALENYPHGRGYGHDYMRGGEVLGGYGYAEQRRILQGPRRALRSRIDRLRLERAYRRQVPGGHSNLAGRFAHLGDTDSPFF